MDGKDLHTNQIKGPSSLPPTDLAWNKMNAILDEQMPLTFNGQISYAHVVNWISISIISFITVGAIFYNKKSPGYNKETAAGLFAGKPFINSFRYKMMDSSIDLGQKFQGILSKKSLTGLDSYKKTNSPLPGSGSSNKNLNNIGDKEDLVNNITSKSRMSNLGIYKTINAAHLNKKSFNHSIKPEGGKNGLQGEMLLKKNLKKLKAWKSKGITVKLGGPGLYQPVIHKRVVKKNKMYLYKAYSINKESTGKTGLHKNRAGHFFKTHRTNPKHNRKGNTEQKPDFLLLAKNNPATSAVALDHLIEGPMVGNPILVQGHNIVKSLTQKAQRRNSRFEGWQVGVEKSIPVSLNNSSYLFAGPSGIVNIPRVLIPGFWIGYQSGSNTFTLDIDFLHGNVLIPKVYYQKDSLYRPSPIDTLGFRSTKTLEKVFGLSWDLDYAYNFSRSISLSVGMQCNYLSAGLTNEKRIERVSGKTDVDSTYQTNISDWNRFSHVLYNGFVGIRYHLKRFGLEARVNLPLNKLSTDSRMPVNATLVFRYRLAGR